ncbi:hypothetical protein ACFLXW_00650 [Candidatus Dependentiae bacterium]
MKKLLSLSLMLAFGLAIISPALNASPTLKAILHKKFIERKPLTSQEQAHLKTAGKRAVAAGLATLGIAGTAVALHMATDKTPKVGEWYGPSASNYKATSNSGLFYNITKVKPYTVEFNVYVIESSELKNFSKESIDLKQWKSSRWPSMKTKKPEFDDDNRLEKK